MKPIWIVDDDPSIRFVLEKALAREQLPTRSFVHPKEVLEAFDNVSDQALAPSVLVSDIRMPGGNGLQLLEQVHEDHPQLPVIIMTAYSDLDSAVSAFQRGAFEYLPKPFDLPKAVELIKRAVQQSESQAPEMSQSAGNGEMLGQAPAMQDVFRAIGRLSQSNVTVMVTGESGSGKELVARALHKHSPVAGGPFVAINTAAIPKDLLESELFGHERGAFTGAQTQRRGRFEQAEGGTLFLDEIGDLPLDVQVKLLRAVQQGEIETVGSARVQKVNVRLISATNKNLIEEVKEGRFREDLYYRLNVFPITIPALRRRKEDIPFLARTFAERFSLEQKLPQSVGVSAAALALLTAYDWPGNIRQLENAVFRAAVLAQGRELAPSDFVQIAAQVPGFEGDARETGAHAADRSVAGTAPSLVEVKASEAPGTHGTATEEADVENDGVFPSGSLIASTDETGNVRTIAEIEEELIRFALRFYRGQMSQVARKLGIGRSTLYRKLKDYGIDPDNPMHDAA